MNSDRPALSGSKRTFFAVLVVGLILLVAEGLSALYLNVLSANPRPLSVRNAPRHVYNAFRTHGLGPGWHSGGRQHNQAGFRRSSEVERTKPAGTYRVFVMGGSAAYGLDAAPPFPSLTITNEQTLDRKLERLLSQAEPGRRVEVINAAITGYWTHHHLIYLHETILDYDPDLIIFIDGINDYYHAMADHRQFFSYHYGLPLRLPDLNEPTPASAARALLGWARRYSHAAFVLNEGVDRLFHWSRVPDDPCNLEVVALSDLNDEYRARYEAIARRTWVRTLRSILVTLRDQGIAAITTLQPELVFAQSAGMSTGDKALLEIELGNRPSHYSEKKAFLKPLAVKLARETAEAHGATFVDLTDAFDEKDQYFIDYCHLSEAGAERLAEVLLPYVRRTIGRPPTAGGARAGGTNPPESVSSRHDGSQVTQR
jgi:lysophospholipase L1-like esterase